MTTKSSKMFIYENSNNNNINDLENINSKNNNNNLDNDSNNHITSNINVDLIKKHKKYLLSTISTISMNNNSLLCNSNNSSSENISRYFLTEKHDNSIEFTKKNGIMEEAYPLQHEIMIENQQEMKTNKPKEYENNRLNISSNNKNDSNSNVNKINEAAVKTPSSLLFSSSSNFLLNDANDLLNNEEKNKEKLNDINKNFHINLLNQQEKQDTLINQQSLLASSSSSSSSKFINRKKSYIIMNNESEFYQQKNNINNKINVSKANSTGSYSSSSSNSSIASNGVDLSSEKADYLKSSSSKLDLNKCKLSTSSMSSVSSISSNDSEKITQNHNEIEEDLLDETNSDYNENNNNNNNNNTKDNSNINKINSNHNTILNTSFDSDLNYDDENIESSSPSSSSESNNNSEDSNRKRKVSKCELDSYVTSIIDQKEIENNSYESEKNSHGKVKRIKSNVESTVSSNKTENDDFKNYLTRTISEILNSQLILSKKFDKMRGNFINVNKKLKEIEINMRKEILCSSPTQSKISRMIQENAESKINEEKNNLSTKTCENLVKCESIEKDMNSINNKLTNLYGLVCENSYKKLDEDSNNLSKSNSAITKSNQSQLFKCNSAPPPAPFLINSFIQKSLEEQHKQSNINMHQKPYCSTPQKSICLENNELNNNNHQRLLTSVSARLYDENNERPSALASTSTSSLISPFGHHQVNHSPNKISALNETSVGLNRYPYPQKDLISSSNNQIAANTYNNMSYSQFYFNQTKNVDFYNRQHHQSRMPFYNTNNNNNSSQFVSPIPSMPPNVSHNYNDHRHKQLKSSISNPYHHYDSKECNRDNNNNNSSNTNKTAALAAAAAIAAAFAAKSNAVVAPVTQSANVMLKNSDNNNLHRNMQISTENVRNSNKDNFDYDSQDDESIQNTQQTYKNKDHAAVQAFNLMQHTNSSGIRHIPSSAVDHLELSEEIESLVSRDLIKRCIRKAKHRGNFAANLTAELFSKEERISCNCTGTRGKRQLSPRRLNIVKEITFKIYNSNAATVAVLAAAATGNSSSAVAAANSAYQDFEEAWRKECITAIDAKNRSIGRDVIKINSGLSNGLDKTGILNTDHQSLVNGVNGRLNLVASKMANNNYNEQTIPSPYSNSNSNHLNETSD